MSTTTKISEAVAAVGIRRMAATFTLSAAGLAGLQGHEAVVQKVYRDTTGTPTVCMGHTGKDVPAVGTRVSYSFCQDLIRQDTKLYEKVVQDSVTVPITQEQYDALVDFTLNVGGPAFRRSQLLKDINLNQCYPAGAEFMKWTTSKGVVLRGLYNRRLDERKAWDSGCQ